MKNISLWLLLFIWLVPVLRPQPCPAILSLREEAQVLDRRLALRLEKLLPALMEREQIDMWIVICQEYNEDPVYLTLVPATALSARRLSILVFSLLPSKKVDRVVIGRYGIRQFYREACDTENSDPWQCLKKVVAAAKPQRIGINHSETFAFADGLSASLEGILKAALGTDFSSCLVSAEGLAVGWLETRIAEEMELYPHIVGIAHWIIRQAYSAALITPGLTTCADVEWWLREKIRQLGLVAWFQPSVEIQRPGCDETHPPDAVIRRGDLLHCDLGLTYLHLNTDIQEHAYVLKAEEADAPAGLRHALQLGNSLQDILLAEFQAGRSGNEILASALAKAKKAGLRPAIYTHPLGLHGHAAGPTIGLWDQQAGVPGQGDYPLHWDTCYAIELNVQSEIPEWNNQQVRIALEEDAVFTKKGIDFLDGRQTELMLIR